MNNKWQELLMSNLDCNKFTARDIIVKINKYIIEEIFSMDFIVENGMSIVKVNNKFYVMLNKKNHIYAIKSIDTNKYIYSVIE